MKLQRLNVYSYSTSWAIDSYIVDGQINIGPRYYNHIITFDRKPIKHDFFDLIKMFIKDLINKIL